MQVISELENTGVDDTNRSLRVLTKFDADPEARETREQRRRQMTKEIKGRESLLTTLDGFNAVHTLRRNFEDSED